MGQHRQNGRPELEEKQWSGLTVNDRKRPGSNEEISKLSGSEGCREKAGRVNLGGGNQASWWMVRTNKQCLCM